MRVAFFLSVSREASFGGWDGKEYHAYARSLLAHNWDQYARYFNNIRPPFYPMFLVPFVAINDQVVWHIQLAQALLGVCTAVAIAKLVGRWAGQSAGNCTFVVVLFHPFLIYQSAFVLTESLFVLLLWIGIASLQRSLGTRADHEWVASCRRPYRDLVARPSLQAFLPVAVVWLGWRAWQQGWALALKRMAVFTLLVSVLLLPWMIRNLRAHGELSLAPGGAQTAYALSNSPEYLRMYEARTKAEYYDEFQRLVSRFAEKGTSVVDGGGARF